MLKYDKCEIPPMLEKMEQKKKQKIDTCLLQSKRKDKQNEKSKKGRE